ncbi:MAG: right-handed parallel beta-helix repeat-containing protein [Xanthomonadales bacterium]|nr:right-handed parallel beta-helix repeat-containing protein [Xanthomonadales bacterium]MDH3923679.1 right-handed parallel beta-helix repeat-containing protein [Xanthomonadales bacterium]MDH3999713.1 right-handed parallel beta-helix repeat-containing protein [Xanthomonadales bacterium]
MIGKLRHPLAYSLLLVVISICSPCGVDHAEAQSVPDAVIPVGDGPYALDLTSDGRFAVISLLFPPEDEDPNVIRVDLENEVVADTYRYGRRLIRIATVNPDLLAAASSSAIPVVMVNGDVDRLTVVNLDTGQEIDQIKSGQNPSNVEIVQSGGAPLIGNASNLAIMTNGTGGSLSFIDLDQLTAIGEADVGDDPRDVGIEPGGRYLFVVLRADQAVAVLDLQALNSSVTQATGTPGKVKSDPSPYEVSRVGVGKDPATIQISPDGSLAIVANLTNNSISILDITNPRSPRIVRNPKTNSLQIPVGVQPSSIAISPDNTRAYIANAGSNWITVVDLVRPEVLGIVKIQRPDAAVASSAAAVKVSKDGSQLIVAEGGNGANLLVYSIENLVLEPLPEVDIPDEPGTTTLLERAEDEACGFYTAGLTLQEGAEEGLWGMEVLTTAGNRLLEGGLNLGGAFEEDAKNPGFGAFNIANEGNENQIVSITIDATALPTEGFSPENLGVSVQIVDAARNPVTEEVQGSDRVELEAELEPGFYIVRIKSVSGSPRGTFLMSLLTQFVDRPGGGFQGGANVGGFITRRSNGDSTTAFAGFCLSQSQDVVIRTEAQTTRGPKGSGPLILTLRNRQKEAVQVVSNSRPNPPPPDPPPAPSLAGLRIDLYVDDDAGPNGTGSSSRPFRSITEAVGKAAGRGDVILVRPGTYSPSLTGEVLPIGSRGPGLNGIPQGVTLIGSGSSVTIIDAENGLRSGSPVNAMGVGSSNVRIAGFTVRGSSAVGLFVLNADNVQIDHNYFEGNGRFGVGAQGTGGLTISDNVAVANNETGISVAATRKISVSGSATGCPSAFGACIIRNIANGHARDGILLTTGGDYHILNNTALNNGIAGIEVNNRNNVAPLNSTVRGNLTANNGGILFPFAGNGILITEFAHADVLSDNQADNNRPGGIAVFEDSSATLVQSNIVSNSKQNGLVVQKRSAVQTISQNQVVNSGLSGIFIDNSSAVDTIANNLVNDNGSCTECTAAKGGLAILGDSTVGSVHMNSFDNNSLGMQIATNSSADSITESSFDQNETGGVLVRAGSSIPNFSSNSVLGNGGLSAISIDDSDGMISLTEVSSTDGTGVSVYSASDLIIEDSIVSDSPLDGIAVYAGSQLMLKSVDVLDNGSSGVLTAGEGTTASIADSEIKGNQGYGLNAQGESSITCSGSTVVSGNSPGQTLGNVQGCN